jgi:hypothetical protein
MTLEDTEERPSAEEMLNRWKELLSEASLNGRRLNGRVL